MVFMCARNLRLTNSGAEFSGLDLPCCAVLTVQHVSMVGDYSLCIIIDVVGTSSREGSGAAYDPYQATGG